MPNLSRVDLINVNPESSFVFDANIWIYLLDPNPWELNKGYVQTYAGLLKEIISKKSGLVINQIILSEFVNRIARREFDIYRHKMKDYSLAYKKDFRDTKLFDPVKSKLERLVKSGILARCIEKPPCEIPVEKMFDDFISSDVDVNDTAIAMYCNANSCVFVTHDGDASRIQLPVEIWTDNQRLLAAT